MGPVELWNGGALQINVPSSSILTNTFSIFANFLIYQAKWHLVLMNVSLIISKAKHFSSTFYWLIVFL